MNITTKKESAPLEGARESYAVDSSTLPIPRPDALDACECGQPVGANGRCCDDCFDWALAGRSISLTRRRIRRANHASK